jgi:hypothetical protein
MPFKEVFPKYPEEGELCLDQAVEQESRTAACGEPKLVSRLHRLAAQSVHQLTGHGSLSPV